MTKHRVRVRFGKRGDLRMISHRDLVRLWERLLRRAELPLGMSQGFHPKARLSFPSALALGIESWDEVLVFELSRPVETEEIRRRIESQAPAGLTIHEVRLLEPGHSKGRLRSCTYRIRIPAARRAALQRRIKLLAEQSSYWFQRKAGSGPPEGFPALDQLDLQHGVLEFRLLVNHQGGIRVREVIDMLGLTDIESQGGCLIRTAMQIEGSPHNF